MTHSTDNRDESAAPDSFADLREQFDEECVLHALSNVRDIDRENPPAVYFLDEEIGRIYRVLEATRGSPDSGWFALALAGPHVDAGYERQLRVHDSDTHHVLIAANIEYYAYEEPTPDDDVITTSEETLIQRMGEPPAPVGDQQGGDDE